MRAAFAWLLVEAAARFNPFGAMNWAYRLGDRLYQRT